MKKVFFILLFLLNYAYAQENSKIREKGFENLAIGKNALMLSDTLIAIENLALGEKAMEFNLTGKYSTAIGPWNLRQMTTGEFNTSLGNYVLSRLTTGSRNVAIGPNALNHIVDGNDNVALGRLAGFNLGAIGNSRNIFIGTNSGFNGGGVNTNWYGSNNVILGGWAPAQNASMNNTMVFAIGDGTERFRISETGNFGIGISTDNNVDKLQVNGTGSFNSGISITKVASQAQLTGKRLNGTQLGYITFSEKANGFGQGQIGAGDNIGNTSGVMYWDGENRHVRFFGTAEGIDPVNPSDLTTRSWVENNIGTKSKFWAKDSWQNTYFIEHGWDGSGWNLYAANNGGDEQANIHKVNINGNSNTTNSMLWKNYGGMHIIIDASSSISPINSVISNTDAQIAWSPTYPTLMGWNGVNTYGVRVDRARLADISNETFQNITDKGNTTINSLAVALNPNETLRVGHNTNLNQSWFGTGSFGKDGTDKALLGFVSSNTNGAVVAAHNSSLNAWSRLNISGSELLFRIGEEEQMRLISNGNVGIGTSNPTEKLSVNGNIKSKSVKVDPNNWPDYVFEPSYNLSDLESTAKFIKENKHLPEVPSAKEVAEKGHDLGEINTILLKKIEELTLHLIQVNEKLKLETEVNKQSISRITKLEKLLKVNE